MCTSLENCPYFLVHDTKMARVPLKILVAGKPQIPAHRLVLSPASDYFAAMFTNDVRVSMKKIKMKDVDPEALAAVVNFAYTG